ncbi:MAG: hypothetical protein WCT07_03455 [Candidatus Paceibacterota bacterium]|jgi:uncharacterized protein (DUF1778 family)
MSVGENKASVRFDVGAESFELIVLAAKHRGVAFQDFIVSSALQAANEELREFLRLENNRTGLVS